jgi:hypothetical protein
MQITLLPPLLPTDGVLSVPTASVVFTPGARIQATVLPAGREGGTLLSLGGREMLTGGRLPYPPGTTLRLEVVEGGARPLLRLVSVDTVVPAESPARDPAPLAPPVSVVTYGLAAAVLAAREAPDGRAAALAVAQWLPALVAHGVLSAAEGALLHEALAPVPMPVAPPDMPDGTRPATTAAKALADRVADGGLLLERHLADVLRQAHPGAKAAAARDLRSRLAVVSALLGDAPTGLHGAREAVSGLQQALLAEQARAAAHLAAAGVVDVRVPLQVGGPSAETRVRMRLERDAPDRATDDDPTPWRRLRLDLAVEGLGRVQVRLAVLASQVRVEFLVEQPDAADRIEAGLVGLGTALEGVGFGEVLSRVLVDPVTVCAPDALPDLPTAGILDTRA